MWWVASNLSSGSEYDLANIHDWVQAIMAPPPPPTENQKVKRAGQGLGVIDTDWARTFGGLAPTASRAWNSANRTVME